MRIAQRMGIKNSWMAWIPILNVYLICKIGHKSAWWIIAYPIAILSLILFSGTPLIIFLGFAPLIVASVLLWASAGLKILEAAGKPRWWIILLFLPIVQLIFLGILSAGPKSVIKEKAVGFCAQCGAKLEGEAGFCPNCGIKIAKEKRLAKKFCLRCGAQVKAKAKFCPSCGQQLPELKVEEEKPTKNFCPKCGGKLPLGATFCGECGVKISEVEARVKEAKPEAVSEVVSPKEAPQEAKVEPSVEPPAVKKPSRGKRILTYLLWRFIIIPLIFGIIALIIYLISGAN